MKKKILKALGAVVSTAWYAALTFFCFAVFVTALFQIADKFLNNNIVECVLLGIGLIFVTGFVGDYVKGKARRNDGNRRAD